MILGYPFNTTKFFSIVRYMAKVKISGKKMIGKSVKSFDGKDLGKVRSISADYVS